MTGTFKRQLPADLMKALEKTSLQRDQSMEVSAMQPSLVERVVGWFSGR